MPLQAGWWRSKADAGGRSVVECDLCFHNCTLPPGSAGRCAVRIGGEGVLLSPYLGRFVSVAVDPIEKKPLRRWQPGTRILSLGGVGCNMTCPFCQNHEIAHPEGNLPLREISREQLLEMAARQRLTSVAFTYNEPTMQAEYLLAAAPLLASENIAAVMVTNGMWSPSLRGEIASAVAAANVDIKAFDPAIYGKIGGSLETVRGNVEHLVTSGVHVELTSLIVPGISDDENGFTEMTGWIAGLSNEIPLHITRYRPAYRYDAAPTGGSLLEKFRAIAATRLKHVYLGNV